MLSKKPSSFCPVCGLPKWRRITTGPFTTREELKKAIYELFYAGFSGRDISRKFEISEATVSRIRNGDLPQNPDGLPVGARGISNEV